MRGDSRLDMARRTEAWRALDGGSVDVLVVGGGVTGAGVALDAATRGLSTPLF
jgi:glycerol-3-phosphate dehydrogenase